MDWNNNDEEEEEEEQFYGEEDDLFDLDPIIQNYIDDFLPTTIQEPDKEVTFLSPTDTVRTIEPPVIPMAPPPRLNRAISAPIIQPPAIKVPEVQKPAPIPTSRSGMRFGRKRQPRSSRRSQSPGPRLRTPQPLTVRLEHLSQEYAIERKLNLEDYEKQIK